MKIREDFVTNSSSSSFICCFARISNPEKAQGILDKYRDIKVYTSEEVLKEVLHSRWSAWLEWDWAGINVTPSQTYLESHTDDKFIVITDAFDIEETEDGYPNYDVDFEDFELSTQSMINAITEEYGFVDINCQYGAGRNG